MAARWRKEPSETGLARVGQRPRGFELRENGEVLLHVSPLSGKTRWDIVGWYWYGLGMNTCHEPVATPEEAKAQAVKHLKAVRSNATELTGRGSEAPEGPR